MNKPSSPEPDSVAEQQPLTSLRAKLEFSVWTAAWVIAVVAARLLGSRPRTLGATVVESKSPAPDRKRPLLIPKLLLAPAVLMALAGTVGMGAVLAVDELLRPELPEIPPYNQTSMILDSSGQVVATLHGEENRFVVPLEDISANLRKAVIAAEDREFYEHNGVSLRGIIRAARANFSEGETVQGGSTVTQQYVRNAFPQIGTEQTLSRKAKEALWAMEVEREYGKDEILQAYLNTVYFGRGAYGAEAAAQTYFNVTAAELTPGQAAYLAAILRSPGAYQIDVDPGAAIVARNDVLADMASVGFLSKAQARAAEQEDLAAQFHPAQAGHQEGSARAGYFVEYVRRMMKSKFQFTDEQILGGGLRIYTTLDVDAQKAAEEAVASTFDRPEDPEAAMVAMDPQGRVVAMVGGKNVSDLERARGFNFAADVQNSGGGRQAGSAFKPIALASFLEQGNSIYSTYMGRSTMEIESERCMNEDGSPWEVSNYGGADFGALDLLSATTNSVNTVYAQLMDSEVSPEDFMETASALGIEIPQFDRGCALTLGTTDVTPLEMARAYTTFAQRGMRPDPMVITKVTGPDGEVLIELSASAQQVIDPNTADTINYALQRNIQAGTGTQAQIGRAAAGKTGTTQSFQDAWFAGYTPDLTAVVWVGYAPEEDGTIPEMRDVRGRSVTGGSFPAMIWRKFMAAALEATEESQFSDPRLGGRTVTYRVPSDALQIAASDDDHRNAGSGSGGEDEDEEPPAPAPPPPPPAAGGGSPSSGSDPARDSGANQIRKNVFRDCFPFCDIG